MKRIGLIVNPVAGMGGAVGLKGTDGEEILQQARNLGAEPRAELRAEIALARLRVLKDSLSMYCFAGEMGESCATRAGLDLSIVGAPIGTTTTAQDTRRAAGLMVDRGVDLILFAGGDGTARDTCAAIGDSVPALGIPAGVKIHSSVFAASPAAAGEIAASFVQGDIRRFKDAEVMDINEEDYRREILSAQLYGYLKVPDSDRFMQGLKAGSVANDQAIQGAIAADVIEQMSDDWRYLVGPGTTCRPILEQLGLDNTLLGIDLVQAGKQLGKDLSETEILAAVEGRQTKLILTPVGGQGFLLGRGNQQLSSKIIRTVGKSNIIVVATDTKLASLRGNALLVDTGDDATDQYLVGYYRVITAYHKSTVYRVGPCT
jgi:predicted polyphosphate/ATP-dependent NAD kinase